MEISCQPLTSGDSQSNPYFRSGALEIGLLAITCKNQPKQKPLLAGGESEDNIRSWEIVRKINSWPRDKTSSTMFFSPSAKDIILQYTSRPKGFIYFIPCELRMTKQLQNEWFNTENVSLLFVLLSSIKSGDAS